jgi:hypothetical protein
MLISGPDDDRQAATTNPNITRLPNTTLSLKILVIMNLSPSE